MCTLITILIITNIIFILSTILMTVLAFKQASVTIKLRDKLSLIKSKKWR